MIVLRSKSLVRIVEGALKGNQDALSCWMVLKDPLAEDRDFTFEELAEFQDHFECLMAASDGGLSVDLREQL